MDKETKQESSLPVQSRVSIVTLAELEKYWSNEGYQITNMSQLISWSLSLLREVLRANDKLQFDVMSVTEANRHLLSKGLYQKSMAKRGFKKRATALSFENLRAEGVDPAHAAPRQHKMLHNKKSVNPDFLEEAIRRYYNAPSDPYGRLNEEDFKPRPATPSTNQPTEAAAERTIVHNESERIIASGEANVNETNNNEECVLREGSIDDLESFEAEQRRKLEEEKKAMDEWLRSQVGNKGGGDTSNDNGN